MSQLNVKLAIVTCCLGFNPSHLPSQKKEVKKEKKSYLLTKLCLMVKQNKNFNKPPKFIFLYKNPWWSNEIKVLSNHQNLSFYTKIHVLKCLSQTLHKCVQSSILQIHFYLGTGNKFCIYFLLLLNTTQLLALIIVLNKGHPALNIHLIRWL